MTKSDNQIKVFVPVLPKLAEITNYLDLIDQSHQYSNFGPLVLELESRIASFFHVPVSQVVSVNNATSGLIGALSTCHHNKALWYLPSWSYIATAQAAFNARVNFQFCDVGLDNRASFPIESTFVVDVLPFGASGRNYNLKTNLEAIVIDAAASFQNLSNFTFPDAPTALVVSLHATKMIGCGEGGFVVFNDPQWATAFKRWTRFGIDSGRVPVALGVNCKMSEYSAAVALAALDGMHRTIDAWKLLNKKAERISNILKLKYLAPLSANEPSIYWNIELPSSEMLELWTARLRDRGIETRNWWPVAAHKLPFFEKNSDLLDSFPVSEFKARTTLGLPFHLMLTDEDFDNIVNAISTIAEYG